MFMFYFSFSVTCKNNNIYTDLVSPFHFCHSDMDESLVLGLFPAKNIALLSFVNTYLL